MCSVCYWLIGDALLMHSGVVSMRLHLPCFDVCWSFGVAAINLNLYRTHNRCGDKIKKSQSRDDGCINVRNMLSIEEVK